MENRKCSKKRKLQIWNAVIRSKVTYALHTMHLTKNKQKINTFQYKGTRQILKWDTTYINRNTNKRLLKIANKFLSSNNPNYNGQKVKTIQNMLTTKE